MSALSAEEPIDSEEIPPEIPPGKSRMARVPTTMQVVAAECGAACLASVLGFYRAYRPLEEVREAVGVDRDGSNALRIVRAARHFGLEADGLQCEPENFDEITLPAILFWGLNHFVVLEGWTKSGYRIMDPALGRRIVSAEEFNQEFTGVVVQMETSEEFVETGSPPSSLRLVIGWMRGAGVAVWLTVFVGLLLAVPMVAIPGIAATFVDTVLAEERADWMKWILGGVIIALILQSGLIVIQQLILARLEQQLSLERTSDFLQQLFRMPTTFFAQRYPGDIAERVASNDGVAGLLASKFAPAIIQIFTLLAFLAAISWINIPMGIISFLAVSATLSLLFFVARSRVDQAQSLQQQEGMKQGAIIAGLLTLESLKASGREADFFGRSMGFAERVSAARQRASILSNAVSILPAWFQALVVTVLVLSFGGWQVMQGDLTIGMLLGLQILLLGFMTPVTQLAELIREIQTVRADLGRLDDVMCHAVDRLACDPSVDDARQIEYADGNLELRNITFGYGHGQEPLLVGFSLKIASGGRVAIVGGTGSGKSTVARLAAGLIDPWEGEILIDGQFIGDIPRHVRAASVATIFQRAAFFEGTIRENLSLWNVDIPDAWIVEALEDAQLLDLVASRGGLDQIISEGGSNFSGGEAQRLDIARALSRKPAILIMDEATSALDPVTELALDVALRRRGVTCLVVAHRLSTIRDADEIIVLDGGIVVQRGTHDQLLALGGVYQNLIAGEKS
ncbi:NHLP family bacteriocin export ABC transporter peptidase/permease/ATPase [Phycisphaerae bacterium]|nr:NHLP family bacteriocin export ABC transporter peptidase/permease/ATPase [Phycisphaerae bacterium]